MRGYSHEARLLAGGAIRRRPPEPVVTDTEALDAPLPDCIDCGVPIDACECDDAPLGPPSAADRYDMRVDALYDRLTGK